MSTPVRPEVALGGRSLTSAEGTGLERDAIGFWGVFAQGLAAAAPSVAIAVVPFSLFVAAGKGAAWAVLIGLTITVLIAATISFQAKRTVSSGSLGTYTGNGLGPGFAFAAGFSLLVGYIGFATTGTSGGVLYLDSFLESIGLGSQATWFKLLLVVVIVAVAVVSAVPRSGNRGEVRAGLRADRHRLDFCHHRRRLSSLTASESIGSSGISGTSAPAPRSSRRCRRWGLTPASRASRRWVPRPRTPIATSPGRSCGWSCCSACSTLSPPTRRCCSSTASTVTRRSFRSWPTPRVCRGSTTSSARRSRSRSSSSSPP